MRVAVELEADGIFPLVGAPLKLTILTDWKGPATAIELTLPDGKKVLMSRLAK
jgi:hypothetical protein